MSNVTGYENTATGAYALVANTTGANNTATGLNALVGNTNGSYNTAIGQGALRSNTEGDSNVAIGYQALYHNTSFGYNNIAVGTLAGSDLTDGNDNIDIGDVDPVSMVPDDAAGEYTTIRIGETSIPTQTSTYIAGIENDTISGGAAVYITTGGLLGVESSSRRYKQDIKDMGDASDMLFSLRPVSFRYKPKIDPKSLPQFGLLAEDVEKVSPALVVHDKTGKPYTVRYETVNAMLLNEFLKEHNKVAKLVSTVEHQQQEIANLRSSLREQASLLQKVSTQLQLIKPAPQVVSSNN
jgi:hypothetical protein